MSKRKGKNKKNSRDDERPDFRLKRRAHGKVTKVKKSAARSRGSSPFLTRHKGKLQVAAVLAVIVLLAIVATRLGPAPDYDAYWAPDAATRTQQSFHFNVFITVGNATGLATQFVKIPETMGGLAGCS